VSAPVRELWTENLTDAQLAMVIESGQRDEFGGYGVEIRGAQWRTARSLVAGGCGDIEDGAPNGSSLPGLYFNNAHGVEIVNEFKDDDLSEPELCASCGHPTPQGMGSGV
jgi:hypothetical protein